MPAEGKHHRNGFLNLPFLVNFTRLYGHITSDKIGLSDRRVASIHVDEIDIRSDNTIQGFR